MFYSWYNKDASQWFHFHSQKDSPTVLLPARRLAAGEVVAVQEIKVELPDDARPHSVSLRPKDNILVHAQFPCMAQDATQPSSPPWWHWLWVAWVGARIGIYVAERKQNQRIERLLSQLSQGGGRDG